MRRPAQVKANVVASETSQRLPALFPFALLWGVAAPVPYGVRLGGAAI
jgi:hypothetical protein